MSIKFYAIKTLTEHDICGHVTIYGALSLDQVGERIFFFLQVVKEKNVTTVLDSKRKTIFGRTVGKIIITATAKSVQSKKIMNGNVDSLRNVLYLPPQSGLLHDGIKQYQWFKCFTSAINENTCKS